MSNIPAEPARERRLLKSRPRPYVDRGALNQEIAVRYEKTFRALAR